MFVWTYLGDNDDGMFICLPLCNLIRWERDGFKNSFCSHNEEDLPSYKELPVDWNNALPLFSIMLCSDDTKSWCSVVKDVDEDNKQWNY